MDSEQINPEEDFDSVLVESEEDDADIEGTEGDAPEDGDEEFVDCTCDCEPAEHDGEGCTNCADCSGHWE